MKYRIDTFKKIKSKGEKRFSPTLSILTVCLLLGISSFLFAEKNQQKIMLSDSNFLFSEKSFLIPLSNPTNPPLKVIKRFETIITAYSSTPEQTNENPFITASNKSVRDGVIANNYFPFGTKVRIPELYGDKIFVVEDRMNWRKSNYQFDIWHSDYEQAVNFGVEKTYVEILGR